MNSFHREQHKPFTANSHPFTAATANANLLQICAAYRATVNNTQALSAFPSQINPLQLLTHGFETNYASRSDSVPGRIYSSSVNNIHRHRRLSVLWKISGSEQTTSLNKAVDMSTNLQENARPSSKPKFCMIPSAGEPNTSQTQDPEKQLFRRISRRLIHSDSSKLRKRESMYHNKEMLALFEDDFIAFACRKDNNLIQNNFMKRALANIANRLS